MVKTFPQLMPLFLFLLVAGCNEPSSPEHQSESPRPSAAVEGHWRATEAIMAGEELEQELTDAITLSLDGGQYSVSVAGSPDLGTYEMDSSNQPGQLTLKGTAGPNAGKTILAVFDFSSDSDLRICYDLSGTTFPTSFSSTTENGYFLVHYRQDEEPPEAAEARSQ